MNRSEFNVEFVIFIESSTSLPFICSVCISAYCVCVLYLCSVYCISVSVYCVLCLSYTFTCCQISHSKLFFFLCFFFLHFCLFFLSFAPELLGLKKKIPLTHKHTAAAAAFPHNSNLLPPAPPRPASLPRCLASLLPLTFPSSLPPSSPLTLTPVTMPSPGWHTVKVRHRPSASAAQTWVTTTTTVLGTQR